MTPDGDGVRIDVGQEPAGVYFRMALDPSHEYRIVIRGVPLTGTTTLRLRRNTDPVEYKSAPTQPEIIRVSGASTYELLLYSLGNASYRVTSTTVHDRGTSCETDDDLKR